jgi:hypothetical protein
LAFFGGFLLFSIAKLERVCDNGNVQFILWRIV